jgi:glycosyltransferase involved in cell wall biosynthesis
MDAKLISVIVPVYQGEKYLAEALNSIFAQRYRPIEVVAVDDGSTDGTAFIANSYPEVRYVYQANQGPAVSRNTGLANCAGELIAFLDADDYWLPNKLAVQSDYLAAHPELGCVIGKMRNFLDDGMAIPSWISEAMMEDDGGGWHLAASLMHRWVFDRIGHFNSMYPYCDDLEWIVRLREAAIPLDIVPEVFLHRRIHTSNISRNQNALALARVRILKEHLDRKRGRVGKAQSGVRSGSDADTRTRAAPTGVTCGATCAIHVFHYWAALR